MTLSPRLTPPNMLWFPIPGMTKLCSRMHGGSSSSLEQAEVMMTGAFAGKSMGEVFPLVVSVAAKLIGEDGREFAAYAHEALFDSNPEQKESLLSVHQSLRDAYQQWHR